VKLKIPELIIRACRIPKKAVIRMGEISETAYQEHIKPIKPEDLTPHGVLMLVVLITLVLPMLLDPSYSLYLGPYHAQETTTLTLGSEVNSTISSETTLFPEDGMNSTTLLNNTPFIPNRDWHSTNFREYDFNRYAWNDSDGYHMKYDPQINFNEISFRRIEYVPLTYCSDVSIDVVMEGIEGEGGLYLQGWASEEWSLQERVIEAGNVSITSLHLPLDQAKLRGASWLCLLAIDMQVGLKEGAHIIIRSVVIHAIFKSELCRVAIDLQNGEGESLYLNPYMQWNVRSPQLFLTYENDSDSLSVFYPFGVNDTLYLPPGIYEGLARWEEPGWIMPDPLNWSSNVFFEVQGGSALHISIRVNTVRLGFDYSLKMVYRYLHVYFMNMELYWIDSELAGSTLGNPFPEFLYIPARTGELEVYVSWAPLFHGPPEQSLDSGIRSSFRVTIDETNSYRNLVVHITLPFVSVLGLALGVREIAMLTMAGILLCSSVIAFRRIFRYSNLRHRLNDTRLIPVVLLTTSVFVPWLMQVDQYPDTLYIGGKWVVWWATPLVVRWFDGFSGQLLVARQPSLETSFHSTIFLIVPIIYGWIVLARPEDQKLERGFVLSLLLPYLVVLSALDYAAATGSQLSLGLISAAIAFPIWVVLYALKRFGILT
jgi:hypothetical protein